MAVWRSNEKPKSGHVPQCPKRATGASSGSVATIASVRVDAEARAGVSAVGYSIITRSAIGNNGFIITYYYLGNLGQLERGNLGTISSGALAYDRRD